MVKINPIKVLDTFAKESLKIQNNKTNYSKFSAKLSEIGDTFISTKQTDIFTKTTKRLAEKLVSTKKENLAGIIYSYLIKINKNNEKILEELATNALIIAKRQHDPLHIMARTNDLKIIYQHKPNNSTKLLKILYEEKRALTEIVKKYESLSQSHISISRELKPCEKYEEKLAAIKMEIGELLIKQNEKSSAVTELEQALSIYKKIGIGENAKKIENILNTLK